MLCIAALACCAIGFSQTTNLWQANGNIGIGTVNPNSKLTVIGNIGVTGPIQGTNATDQLLDLYADSWVHNGAYQYLFGNGHPTAAGQMWFTSGHGQGGNTTAFSFGQKATSNSGDYARTEFMTIQANGLVRIGTPVDAEINGYRLAVGGGGLIATKVKVAIQGSPDWADYVFAPDYSLMDLSELRTYVAQNRHLPGVPSAEEVVNKGLDLGKMDAKLLEKVEELTLYILELESRLAKLEQTEK